jgi:nitrous oxidase accessory protein NosD
MKLLLRLAGCLMIVGLAMVAGNRGQVIFGQAACTVTVQPEQSIQQAIDQAPERAVLCVGSLGKGDDLPLPQRWKETLVIKRSLTLRGVNLAPPLTRIEARHLGQPVIKIESDAEIEVTFDNLTVAEAKNADGIEIDGPAKVVLTKVQSSDNFYDGVRAGDLSAVTLQDSIVANNGGDGLFSSGAKVKFEGNVIQDNKGCGINLIFSEIQVFSAPQEMHGNGADLCGFAPASLREPLVPQTQKTQLTVPGDFPSLQEAVDAIAPDGTIIIGSGTFETGLTIWKPLTLQGTDKAQSMLKALPDHRLTVSIIAEAQGVVLDELTVTGGVTLYSSVMVTYSQTLCKMS